MKTWLLWFAMTIGCCVLVLSVNWLRSQVTLIGAIGVVLVVLSVVRLRWPKMVLFWPGLVLFISALVGFGYIAISSPGGEVTVDVARPPIPGPTPVSLLDSLCLSWDSTSYPNWPVAELLASVSEKAYLTPVEAKTSYRTLGFDEPESFEHGSMFGYVLTFNDAAIIVFRGTDDRADWFVNLDTIPAQTRHGEVHKGFFDSYQPLKRQIITLLRNNKPKHLWITGHSLGGALAVVCAYDLVENEKQKLDGIITFGQPMVAHKQLAEYLGEALFGRYAHYVNDNDIVPRVAPGYAHCGSLVWFTEGGVKQSKPKHRVVGATKVEKSAPSQAEGPVQLSDVDFVRMKAVLGRTNVKGGMKRQRVGAVNEAAVTSIDEAAFPPFSEKQFKEIKGSLREEFPPPERRRDRRVIVEGKTPWLRDHSMALYVEKIQSYFGKTESKQNEHR